MKKNNTPRRKRLTKASRLASAKTWIKSYTGKDLVKGYAKWFGVDLLCALAELKLCGIGFTLDTENQIVMSYRHRIENKRSQKQLRSSKASDTPGDDENLAVIIGYTSNGASYGLTYKELETCENLLGNKDLDAYQY